jgi:hypothetical protein
MVMNGLDTLPLFATFVTHEKAKTTPLYILDYTCWVIFYFGNEPFKVDAGFIF